MLERKLNMADCDEKGNNGTTENSGTVIPLVGVPEVSKIAIRAATIGETRRFAKVHSKHALSNNSRILNRKARKTRLGRPIVKRRVQ